MAVSYNSRSINGFYASLDFELKDGKVDWEIVNPDNITVYKGYVIYEKGKTYRELTDSMYSLNGYSCFKNREEVTNITDSNGKEVEIPDYSYLQFEMNSLRGIYQLILKPESAEGSYRIDWSNKLPRK
jgi:hypothetical protein